MDMLNALLDIAAAAAVVKLLTLWLSPPARDRPCPCVYCGNDLSIGIRNAGSSRARL